LEAAVIDIQTIDNVFIYLIFPGAAIEYYQAAYYSRCGNRLPTQPNSTVTVPRDIDADARGMEFVSRKLEDAPIIYYISVTALLLPS